MSWAGTTSIRGGRLIDPVNGIDAELDLHIAEGRILSVGKPPPGFAPERVIDARGQVVCPGLIDLAANLREPGQEHKATIASETAAAARGGITTLICTPDTDPVIDTPAVWELIRRRAKAAGKARVLAVGALTQGLRGDQLAEMAALKAAGCVAVGNANRPLASTLVERRALEYAGTFGLTVFLRPEDRHLKAGGCAHEGAVATRLGLPGIPSAAETVAVARDLALAEHTGATVHFRSLSTASAARMVRDARAAKLAVSADVAIHQLHLTEQDVDCFNASCHVAPPLRTLADRDALRAAVADGSIAVICSDHQPHDPDAKEAPFPETAPGISGLETLLALTLRLVEEHVLDLPTAIARLTAGPARVLGLPLGSLSPEASADVCVFDPAAVWTLRRHQLLSGGHNTPFDGWEFHGRVTHTLFEGRLVHAAPRQESAA
jgi:dihydroorotase